MRDQAAELRSLVLKSLRQSTNDTGPQPRLIAVTGGKGGVGATTLAVNLSMAMAHYGLRVVLVDANLCRADVALLCGVEGDKSVLDVLAGTYDIHEVLQRGPAGIQVAPGNWMGDRGYRISETALLRLVKQLKTLGRHADVVVIDTGSGSGETIRTFWEAASDVILVTTPDSVSVMDSYATLKMSIAKEHLPAVRVVVNRAAGKDEAADVFQRLGQSCRRFLQVEVSSFGYIPKLSGAATASDPLLTYPASGEASRQIQQLAADLAGSSVTRAAA